MTHIKITGRHTGDERWIEAGSDAFAVHVWALEYCDQQESDGSLSRSMAERLALPVPADRSRAAVDKLIELDLWSTDANGRCQINDYGSYALLADEIQQTRGRWAQDKRRSRKHNNGVHDECEPRRCPAARQMSTLDTSEDATTDSVAESSRSPNHVSRSIPDPTRPDSTRPDPTFGEGSGRGRREGNPGQPQPASSADATHASQGLPAEQPPQAPWALPPSVIPMINGNPVERT